MHILNLIPRPKEKKKGSGFRHLHMCLILNYKVSTYCNHSVELSHEYFVLTYDIFAVGSQKMRL